MPTFFETGNEVEVTWSPTVASKWVGRHAVVVGVVGYQHCNNGQVYNIEFAQGVIGSFCSCCLKKAAKHSTPGTWKACPWHPKGVK